VGIPFAITSTIGITLLSVIVPFFIFAVTLLGNAIERAKEEESKTKEQERKDFEIKINDIENKIKAAKETGDSSELEKQLEELKKNKKKFNVQLKNIQRKYSLLKFKESVVFPGGFFILSILLNEVAKIYEKSTTIGIYLWLLAVIAIAVGIYRLCQALILVQEVGIASEELQIKKFAQAIKIALVAHEKEKEEELSIEFREINFPYTCTANYELEINFRVKLKKGKIARKVEVWIYIPNGFVLVSPSEDKSWRQGNDFVVPNIRTVKINLSDISIGPYTPGSLKVRVPNVAGEYFLMYSLRAEGYSGSREQVKIIVT
jgi:ABC-type multidrug transport system fused ATPase/permease subunit